MSRRRIRLHIDQIVLHGVDPGNKPAFARALRTELGRLLGSTAASDLNRRRAVSRIDAGKVQVKAKSANLARKVAGAVYTGVIS